MLLHIQVDRWNLSDKDADIVIRFLQAIGFNQAYENSEGKRSALLTAPRGVFGINALSAYPAAEAGRMITVVVSNPDVVFDIAQKFELKVLENAPHPEGGSRVFSLKLPGDIVMNVVGGAPEPPPGIEGKLDGVGKKFAIVVSRFNAFITERLLHGALDALRRSRAKQKTIVRVPGSFEIPSAARTLAETGKYDAIICLGCLLRGDTAHYDVIVNEVTRGIGQSAQETGVPHAFGVLTCDTLEQAIDRAGLKMGNKGFEAALAAVEMANLKKAVVGRRSSVVSQKRDRKMRSRKAAEEGLRSQVSGPRKNPREKRH
jgi:6,7-dimethyl-8-ribityllumazine synthase